MRRLVVALAFAALFVTVSLSGLSRPGAAPASAAGETPPAVVRGHLDAAAPASGTAEGADAGRGAVAHLSEEVTILVHSSPGAGVRWGGTFLGTTPLRLVRKRESGPLDLTLSATGYLSTHVRAYTFSDETLNIRLVPVSQKQTVFGYPASLDAGVPGPPGPESATPPSAP